MTPSEEARLKIIESFGFEAITCVSNLGYMYGINKDGDIFSVRKMGILSRSKNNLGYEQVYLTELHKGRGQWHRLHRLVASHYIPNPHNLSDVNHKNGKKDDNRVDNLEWMSHSDNIMHSYNVLGRIRTGRGGKKLLCTTTGKEFPSLNAACEEYDLKASNVCMCCKGKLKSTKGYSFKYI